MILPGDRLALRLMIERIRAPDPGARIFSQKSKFDNMLFYMSAEVVYNDLERLLLTSASAIIAKRVE